MDPDNHNSDFSELRRMLYECQEDDGTKFAKCTVELDKLFNGLNDEKLTAILLSSDSLKQRTLLAIIERFVHLSWHQSRFKSLAANPTAKIASIFFQIAAKINFTKDKVWFGGVSRVQTFNLVCSVDSPTSATEQDDHTQFRLNSIAYFSVALMLLGFMDKVEDIVPVEQIELLLHRIDSTFSSSACYFTDVLVENDERCLRTMSALLKLNLRNVFNSVPEMLDPDVLFLLLLHKIHFDPLVIIDWIGSEPELSYIFLKSYSHRFAQFPDRQQILNICNRVCQLSAVTETKWAIGRRSKMDDSYAEDSHFHFEIDELHGEQLVSRKISIPTTSNNFLYKEPHQSLPENAESLCQLVASFCENLAQKIEKFSPSLCFPSKTICENLSAIQSTISGTAKVE